MNGRKIILAKAIYSKAYKNVSDSDHYSRKIDQIYAWLDEGTRDPFDTVERLATEWLDSETAKRPDGTPDAKQISCVNDKYILPLQPGDFNTQTGAADCIQIAYNLNHNGTAAVWLGEVYNQPECLVDGSAMVEGAKLIRARLEKARKE